MILCKDTYRYKKLLEVIKHKYLYKLGISGGISQVWTTTDTPENKYT